MAEVTTTFPEVAPGVSRDPRYRGGQPCVNFSLPTICLAERFKAGESVAHLAKDYELSVGLIEAAIRYEVHLWRRVTLVCFGCGHENKGVRKCRKCKEWL